MDQEINDLIVSLKKQNANSVFELLKSQRRMAVLENKVKALEKALSVLIQDKENHLVESNRLTIEKLHELRRFL